MRYPQFAQVPTPPQSDIQMNDSDPDQPHKGAESSADRADPGPGSPTARPRTPEEVQDWMVAYLARILETSPADIDVDASFEQFALDSVNAIGMTGDLEEWLGARIDPMTVYDYPTIRSMSRYLAEQSAMRGPS